MCKVSHASSFLVMCLLTVLPAQARISVPNPASFHQKNNEIMLDGKKTIVYFNDGDTFKILSGEHEKSRVRVSGLNTLETYGPVHQWRENTEKELMDVANKATKVVQKGKWNCQLQKGKDTYGRLLAICDDLAQALIEQGLAHAYSIDQNPADINYLKTQKMAQEKGVGMWKKGIPDFIITSLHSITERDVKVQENYNRLISTKDGHSEKMEHKNEYATCEKVCLKEKSCMIYVPYQVRYGNNRPECIKSDLGGHDGSSHIKTAARRTN